MLRKNLKLLVTMVGLVALLVMGLALRVVTQEEPKGPLLVSGIGYGNYELARTSKSLLGGFT